MGASDKGLSFRAALKEALKADDDLKWVSYFERVGLTVDRERLERERDEKWRAVEDIIGFKP